MKATHTVQTIHSEIKLLLLYYTKLALPSGTPEVTKRGGDFIFKHESIGIAKAILYNKTRMPRTRQKSDIVHTYVT